MALLKTIKVQNEHLNEISIHHHQHANLLIVYFHSDIKKIDYCCMYLETDGTIATDLQGNTPILTNSILPGSIVVLALWHVQQWLKSKNHV